MYSIIKNQKGQALIEFALCIIVFCLFVFGLFTVTMWGAASYFTQEISHEVARKYAVTENSTDAIKRGQLYMGKMAYMFIDTSSVDIQVDKRGTVAVANVTAEPKIKKYLVFYSSSISKTSEATLEHYIRNPEEYL